MKILMVVATFMPVQRGGAEMQCWRQARALAARGHQVTILTPWWWLKTGRKEIREGVLIRRVGCLLPVTSAIRRLHRWIRRKIRPQRAEQADPFSADGGRLAPPRRRRWRLMAPVEWLGHLSFIAESALLAKTACVKADVVHVHESHWIAGFAQWLAEQLDVPVFCKEALGEVLSWPGNPDVPWLKHWKSRRMSCHYLAMTGHLREQLIAAGIPSERISILPNGVEIPENSASPGGSSLALYIGNFSQGSVYKGFDVLFKAWGRAVAAEPGMRLKMFGSGDARRWQLVARQEEAGDTIEFAGRTENVTGELMRAGFLVLPSRVEGMSNVLLEAQAAGLPVIVSDIPGNTAVVQDGLNGLVVPVEDVNALATAMIRLFKSPRHRTQMGEAARMRMQTEFSIEVVAIRLEQLFQQALGQPPKELSCVL